MGCCTTARGDSMSSRERVLDHIRAERERQIAKHGDHRREAGTWALILNEETGEVARAVLECNQLVERDHQALYEELVQTAAVAAHLFGPSDGDMLASGWAPQGADHKALDGLGRIQRRGDE
jgi:NTP pyrophosphatase (non-canonical NTP hydrolase)